MKKIAAGLLLTVLIPLSSSAENRLWFREPGEYIAFRSVRQGMPTDTSAKIFTDGKRFDASLGKRLPVFTWNQQSPSSAWTMGVDGGMLASLTRYSRGGKLTFATNTFDGFFGAFIGTSFKGWLLMARFGHLSAHLVDNSPQFLNPIAYSQFWPELIVGKTFPSPDKVSDWDLHLQGSIGVNTSSIPANKGVRSAAGVTFSQGLAGPDSYAIVASADTLNAGVANQKSTYAFFLGLGTLNRPNSTRRPARVGLAYFSGSDYRNQLHANRQDWLTAEFNAEF